MSEVATQKRACPFRIGMLAAASRLGAPLSDIQAVRPWLGLCPTRYKLDPGARQARVEVALGPEAATGLLDAWWALSYLGWALEIEIVSSTVPAQRLTATSLAQVLTLIQQIKCQPPEQVLYSSRPKQMAVGVGG